MVMIYEQKQRTEQRFLCHLGVLFVCCAISTKFNLILKAKKREREWEWEWVATWAAYEENADQKCIELI